MALSHGNALNAKQSMAKVKNWLRSQSNENLYAMTVLAILLVLIVMANG